MHANDRVKTFTFVIVAKQYTECHQKDSSDSVITQHNSAYECQRIKLTFSPNTITKVKFQRKSHVKTNQLLSSLQKDWKASRDHKCKQICICGEFVVANSDVRKTWTVELHFLVRRNGYSLYQRIWDPCELYGNSKISCF